MSTTTRVHDAAPMPITLLGWRPFVKGGLRGFARVRLGKSLTINDVPIMFSHGRAWAAMPGKPVIGADGVAQRDERGRQRYAAILEWADRATSTRFSDAVIAAIKREHGDAALDESVA